MTPREQLEALHAKIGDEYDAALAREYGDDRAAWRDSKRNVATPELKKLHTCFIHATLLLLSV